MHKKYVYCLIVLGLLCLLPTIRDNCEKLAASLFQRYQVYEAAAQALPKEGQYFCEELNALLTFGDSITVHYADGSEETLYRPHHDAAFDGSRLDAGYRWDQKQDVVELTFRRLPGEFSKSKTYFFVKQGG